MSDLANELKLKSFETERTQLVYEETVKNLKESQLDVEKLQKKTEVKTLKFWTLKIKKYIHSSSNLLCNNSLFWSKENQITSTRRKCFIFVQLTTNSKL